ATVAAAERASGDKENEVVAVVRPEEVEVAATRADLAAGYLTSGVVDEGVFTGALERLRLRLDPVGHGPLLAFGHGCRTPARLAGGHGERPRGLAVTGRQTERAGFGVRPAQNVVLGGRPVHVLPTPLPSFAACAASAVRAEALSRQGLLTELAARMKTRIGT